MNTKKFWDSHSELVQSELTWQSFYFARTLLPTLSGKRILDLGCGVGGLLAFFAKNGASVVGVDFSSKMIDMARLNCREQENVEFIKADITNIDLGETFDIICGSLVLHEISHSNTPNLIRVIKTHLKPTGFGWFQENSFFNPNFDSSENDS